LKHKRKVFGGTFQKKPKISRETKYIKKFKIKEKEGSIVRISEKIIQQMVKKDMAHATMKPL
jgi:hypothetical protein